MNRVLFVNHEPIGARMTGPTIRNWELARVVARAHEVTIAAPGRPERAGEGFAVTTMDGSGTLAGLVAAAEVVVISGYLLEKHPELRTARHLVVDLNGPFTLENLHMHADVPLGEQMRIAAHDREVLTRLIQAGDVFLCSGERQRDYWTGWLAAAGRVNPAAHAADPAFDGFFKLVPFGVSDEPPRSYPRRYRGVVPGLGEDDFIVMWSSGIWNWFDPITLVHAVDRLRDRLPHLRLLFAAPSAPAAAGAGPMTMGERTRALADGLGLTGRQVFFGSWSVYEERGSILREADVVTSLHSRDIETRYSFRTRLLDWFWAGVPILTTEGDILSDVVRDEGCGEVVPYADVEAVMAAIVRLEGDRQRLRAQAERATAVAARYTWTRVAEPLLEYCDAPYAAPDREALRNLAGADQAPASERRRLAARAAETLREEGPAGLARKGAGYLRKVSRRKR